MIGVSIRLALALGLHLRNENTALDDSKKEPLVRTWWCLHAIECLVSSITGRPPVIGHEDCTVSLPKSNSGPLNPDNSSSRQSSRVRTSYESPQSSARSSASQSDRGTDDSSYLVAYINLNLISQKVLLSLYSPRTAARSWEVCPEPYCLAALFHMYLSLGFANDYDSQHIQTRITELLNELDDWAKIALPSEYLHASSWAPQPDVDRERYLFRIYYWSTRILITRPCLCRIERRIESESSRSAIFNAKTAELCVQAAEQITSLFPNQPDTTFIYSRGPWWDVVHISKSCRPD